MGRYWVNLRRIFTFVWNKKLGTILHWDYFTPTSPLSLYLWTPPQCSGLQAEGCWAFNLSNIQTFHFTSGENCLKYFSQVLWDISLICVKYFLQEQEVVSEALWIGYLAWSPASGLSSQLQTSLIIRNQEVQIWQMYLQILVKIYFCISVFLSRHQMIKFHKGPSASKVIISVQHS